MKFSRQENILLAKSVEKRYIEAVLILKGTSMFFVLKNVTENIEKEKTFLKKSENLILDALKKEKIIPFGLEEGLKGLIEKKDFI